MRGVSKSHGYIGAGLFGVMLSAGYLRMTLDLPMGEMDQPGAGVFPLLITGILFFASLSAIWEGWRNRKTNSQLDLPVGEDRLRLLKLIALLTLYFLAIPWLSFSVSSVVFCTLLIRLLSDLTWARASLYALIMSGIIYLIFIFLLKVPMPGGVLIDLFRT
ncbi:tripartite tricarboxylate transporter TctB family protein [Zwartia sp.]|uniref:tripartite tricarboxylate transporter TctB family protein n=1 Tax=Zwartia sp. TaxID=2978004 RepID=UPI002718F805|nr:tripartite tricarboxylate transporter TctB family protein [Zwartia sp.]MDO9024280.1 tripartite tricarboxylate transporter TctB family protein [Zwartia sp.]